MITADQLLAGPRGRRMLLEYASLSDREGMEEFDHDSFLAAFFDAAHNLDPGRGVSRVRISVGGDAEFPVISAEETARRLELVNLLDVTSELLRTVLALSVDNSRPFQEPDGEDFLAETPPMLGALRRVADHLSRSSDTDWWNAPLVQRDQWLITWRDPQMSPAPSWLPQTLSDWREETVASNLRAQRERPADPAANFSGEWWSIPPFFLKRSSRTLWDGSPAGLWFVEDSMGFEGATASHLRVADEIRVYEIESAESWAELCRRYPLDVSHEKKHDWYRSTGRVGRWLIPDWSLVAADYDAIHLTVAAYISAVSTAIPVDEETASVIAGWNPNETWWLTDVTSPGESEDWILETLPDYTRRWVRA